MSCNVVVKPLAEQDASAAYDYYESLTVGLGGRFLDELDRVLALIAEHLEMYQEVLPGVRRALTRVFPSGVFYVCETNTAFVIAIVANMRDPTRWQSRTGT
jgi:plasmid stabilization system protein ParE